MQLNSTAWLHYWWPRKWLGTGTEIKNRYVLILPRLIVPVEVLSLVFFYLKQFKKGRKQR